MKVTPDENGAYIGSKTTAERHADNDTMAEYYVQRDGIQVRVTFEEYLAHMAKLVSDRIHKSISK